MSRDRIAYWRDAVCESYVQLGCEISETADFHGVIEIERLPNLFISKVGGTGGKVSRRRNDIRRATKDYFLFSLPLEQTTIIKQREEVAVLRPGDMAAYSSTEPYELSMTTGFRQIVLQIPKAPLLIRMPNAELLLGKRIDGSRGIGNLIGQSIIRFSEFMPNANERLSDQIGDILTDFIAAALASISDSSIEFSSSAQLVLLRAKSVIRLNFRNSQFDRSALAKSVGVSVRRLNEVFAKQETSVSEAIRETRLQMAAEELRDRRKAGLSVSDIALRNGFDNFSHFSAIFRRRFRLSPREWRSKPGVVQSV
jgi:AraC family transcriptional activator of tynA and feaB